MKVCVIGGGPGGMSCSLWLRLFGYQVTLLNKEAALGGAQRLSVHPNPWVLGFPGETGKSLTTRMVNHFESLGVDTVSGAHVTAINLHEDSVEVAFEHKGYPDLANADYLVLATGARAKSTPVLTELAQLSPLVLIGAAALDVSKLRNKRVAILGGGDNALENAIQLSRRQNAITVIARNAFVARRDFIDQCRQEESVTLRPFSIPSRFTERAEEIELELDGELLTFDLLIVLYGYTPNTDFLEEVCPDAAFSRDSRGYLVVDAWQRTNVPRVYAIGEMTNTQLPSVLTSIAQGAVAAKAIDRRCHGIDDSVWG